MNKTPNGSEVGGHSFTKWSRSATVGDRLRWLLEHRGMKQIELAQIMKRMAQDDPPGIPKQSRAATTQSSISNVITQASRKPNAPTLLRMAAALQASAEWIMTGEGHPFQVNTISRRSEKDLLELFREMDPNAQTALLSAARAMVKK